MKKTLFSGSMFFFFSAAAANIINYGFNMSMGRLLSLSDYSIFLSLIALLYVFGIPTATIQNVVVKYTSSFHAQNSLPKIKYLFQKASQKVFFATLVFYLLFLLFTPLLAGFLKIYNYPLFALFGLVAFFLFLITISRAVLMGRQQFFAVSLNNIAEPISKLLLALLLVWAGAKVYGAVSAVLFGLALAYFLSVWQLKNVFAVSAETTRLANFSRYFWATIAAVSALALFQNGDFFLVKHFFSPEEAGLYGGITTIGRIVFFIAMPLVSVMYPIVAGLQEKQKSHSKILWLTFFSMTIIALAALLVFYFSPHFVVKLLFGSKFLPLAWFLPLYGLAMLVLCLNSLFINYYLALGKTKFAWPLLLIILLEFILIWRYHSSVLEIGKILLFIQGLTFVFLLFIYLRNLRLCAKTI